MQHFIMVKIQHRLVDGESDYPRQQTEKAGNQKPRVKIQSKPMSFGAVILKLQKKNRLSVCSSGM